MFLFRSLGSIVWCRGFFCFVDSFFDRFLRELHFGTLKSFLSRDWHFRVKYGDEFCRWNVLFFNDVLLADGNNYLRGRDNSFCCSGLRFVSPTYSKFSKSISFLLILLLYYDSRAEVNSASSSPS